MEEGRDDLVAELVDLSTVKLDELDSLPSGVLAQALRRLVEEDGNEEQHWMGFQDST